jgi:hypothetical protein
MSCYARHHFWPDFFALVEREYIVRGSGTRQNAM